MTDSRFFPLRSASPPPAPSLSLWEWWLRGIVRPPDARRVGSCSGTGRLRKSSGLTVGPAYQVQVPRAPALPGFLFLNPGILVTRCRRFAAPLL